MMHNKENILILEGFFKLRRLLVHGEENEVKQHTTTDLSWFNNISLFHVFV